MAANEAAAVGFNEAKRAIFEGRAEAHALWVLLSDEHQRDGYAIKPSPWEGGGEYQRVTFADGRDVFVRLPDHRPLPRTPSFPKPKPRVTGRRDDR